MVKEVASIAPAKVFTLDGAGALQGPATKGLNVYLAEPPRDGKTFDWKHFVVGDAGELDDESGAPSPLATAINWWCLFSTQPIAATELDGSFGPKKGAFDKPLGFPLPTQWKEGKLCLPELRKLTLQVFDISGVADPVDANDAQGRTQTREYLDATQRFYDRLLIQLDIQPQQRPTSAPDDWLLFRAFERDQLKHKDLFDKDPKNYHENSLEKVLNGSMFDIDPQPDLSTVLPIQGDARKTVVLVWVQRFVNFGNTLGVAWPTTPISGLTVKQFELFTVTKPAMILMARQVSASGTNAVAHEIGHCLLHDPGLGTAVMDRSKQRIVAFLNKLKLRLKYEDIYSDRHAPQASNLMYRFGGETLLPWQVAVIRAAHELVPSAGLMPAPP